MDHFTVVGLVAWPLNESETGVDFVFTETSLLFLCKLLLISMKTASFTHNKSSEVSIKTRSPPASLPSKGQATIKYQIVRIMVYFQTKIWFYQTS